MSKSTEDTRQPESQAAESAQENEQSEIEKLREALQAAESKAQENYELALRAKADAENQVRRAEREAANAKRYALERFVSDLVPVLDSMEQGLAIDVQDEAARAMRDGLELTMKLLLEAMEKHGVERVDPQGKPFNPDHHEAMSMVESDEVDPHHVLQVFQKGYLLNGRVVRPARVVVAKAASKAEEKGEKKEQ